MSRSSTWLLSAVTRRLRKNRSTTLILRMNGGSVQPELASPRRYGKSTQLTMLKKKNKWWCNYTGQDTVVIEEADPKNMEHLADRLKVWADRYPFPGEIKGGRIEDPTTQGHCNSNYTPEECFPNSNDLEPILRRFKVVNLEPILLLILNTQSLNSNETCREAQVAQRAPAQGVGIGIFDTLPQRTASVRASVA